MAFLDRARSQTLDNYGASNMMHMIYGAENAIKIKNHYYELSSRLGDLVEKVVYDTFWAREGLSLKEKSLITLISLISLNKNEQLQSHLNGYINLGGSLEYLASCLNFMESYNHKYAERYTQTLFETINTMNIGCSCNDNIVSNRDKEIIALSICIALGDQTETKECIKILKKSELVTSNEIENIMLHQIMYCGFPCAMNGFSVLKGFGASVFADHMVGPVIKSEMMDLLYGDVMSDTVYNRCHELSPAFNKLVQEIVYDVFWRRSGTSIVQKSLVTIVTLSVLKKEEQLRIHLGGYLNLGAKPEDVIRVFLYMKVRGYIDSFDMQISMLKEISGIHDLESDSIHDTALDDYLCNIIDLISSIAIGDKNKINESSRILIKNGTPKSEVENLILHEMMYCGLPSAMTGFASLGASLGISDVDKIKSTDKIYFRHSK